MKYILDYEGKKYRKFFEDICSIPHVSFKEKALSDYVVDFAKERGLWYHQDEVNNVIVKKPASPGYEEHPPVMIQGHLDMVGVKAADSDHDFDKDPIPVYVEDGFIRAKGTTLGADCGHGLSYMLGILDDKTLEHPTIEALFTVQEEVGVLGPQHLDYSLLSAKRLIFTDSMEEGRPEMSTTTVVGGDLIKAARAGEATGSCYEIKIDGLQGGHGAVNINQGRGNAIHLMARALLEIMENHEIRLVSFSGGDIRNNIPKIAEARFICDSKEEALKAAVEKIGKDYSFEFRIHDPDINVEITGAGEASKALGRKLSEEIIRWVVLLPTGTYAAALDDPSFPWTSRNLGTIRLEDDKVIAGYQYRSSMKSHIEAHMKQMEIINDLYDVKWEKAFGYSGYVASEGVMYRTYEEVYKEMSGRELIQKHIHAGTDVGTIIDGMGGDMDVIGIGPNTYKFHTPFEEMELESYDRAYTYIVNVLKRL